MKVITTGVADFCPPAMLGLSKEQAAARGFALNKTNGGYAVLKPVQFKAGEVLTIEGDDIPKGMESVLEPVEKQKPAIAQAAVEPAAKASTDESE